MTKVNERHEDKDLGWKVYETSTKLDAKQRVTTALRLHRTKEYNTVRRVWVEVDGVRPRRRRDIRIAWYILIEKTSDPSQKYFVHLITVKPLIHQEDQTSLGLSSYILMIPPPDTQ
ncbi:hypothetical protein M0804_003823 [Polistes exclamans]|nr:hypothetical protein M0804_003823 [Polistes exclamans]